MSKEFCESLIIQNYLNMKIQSGILEVKDNKIVDDVPPVGSKFDGTDGWIAVEVGSVTSF